MLFLWHFLKLERYRSVFEHDILFSWLSFAHTPIHMLNNITLYHSCFLVCWTRMQRLDSFKWWHMSKHTNLYRLSRRHYSLMISYEQEADISQHTLTAHLHSTPSFCTSLMHQKRCIKDVIECVLGIRTTNLLQTCQNPDCVCLSVHV